MSMSVQENIQDIRARMGRAAARSGRDGELVRLLAVSKYQPHSLIRQAIDAGQQTFGENYLQDAIGKIETFPDVAWHFIGRIQSNKTRLIAQHFDVVETVDRLKVAQGLETHLRALDKTMLAYVQVNLGNEEQKAGIAPDELGTLLVEFKKFTHLKLAGLMGLPPFHDNPERTRPYFRKLRLLAQSMAEPCGVVSPLGLSMGMSGDFEVAIEEGATLVRVGTAIFGEREG